MRPRDTGRQGGPAPLRTQEEGFQGISQKDGRTISERGGPVGGEEQRDKGGGGLRAVKLSPEPSSPFLFDAFFLLRFLGFSSSSSSSSSSSRRRAFYPLSIKEIALLSDLAREEQACNRK
ncbi:hypothetical protein EJ110_NYTH33988 [Nymphaea thermarum]|nr:hypothetical protein EJ110_NYTH33988 [Nymphaea thermarum]